MTGRQYPVSLADFRMQRDIERIHRLGPRAFFNLLDEIACRFTCRLFIEDRARCYADLDPDVVAAFGGDSFPR